MSWSCHIKVAFCSLQRKSFFVLKSHAAYQSWFYRVRGWRHCIYWRRWAWIYQKQGILELNKLPLAFIGAPRFQRWCCFQNSVGIFVQKIKQTLEQLQSDHWAESTSIIIGHGLKTCSHVWHEIVFNECIYNNHGLFCWLHKWLVMCKKGPFQR